MRPAVARDCYVVERTRSNIYALVFVGVFSSVTGLLIGHWTAEPLFAEREASLREYVENARKDADRIRASITDSIRRGCYDYTIRRKEM